MKFEQVFDTSKHAGGLNGYIAASYRDLALAFGEPSYDMGDLNRVSTRWLFRSDDGAFVSIYDYKETNLYSPDYPSVEEFRMEPSYDWHIGAKDKAVVAEFEEWLMGQVGAARAKREPEKKKYLGLQWEYVLRVLDDDPIDKAVHFCCHINSQPGVLVAACEMWSNGEMIQAQCEHVATLGDALEKCDVWKRRLNLKAECTFQKSSEE